MTINSFIILLGLIQWITIDSRDILLNLGWKHDELGDVAAGEYVRAVSILLAANELGYTASILLFGLILKIKYPLHKVPGQWLFMTTITIMVLLVTFSRSSWFGTIVGLVMLFVLYRRVRLIIGFFPLIIPVIFALSSLPVESGEPSVADMVSQRVVAAFDSLDGSTYSRLIVLGEQLSLILRNPMGYGLGGASRVSEGDDRRVLYSESFYIQTAIEVGWIGLFLLISVFFVIILSLVRKSFRVGGDQRNLTYWAIAATLSVFSGALVFPSLGYLVPPAQMAILVGLALNQPSTR